MLRAAFCVFIFAAVFQRVVCDVDCFIEQDSKNLENLFFKVSLIKGFTVDFCRPVRVYINETRNATKDCRTKKIDMNQAEEFTKEFCTVGWDLNNRYLDEEPCFKTKLENAEQCAKNLTLEIPQNKTDLKKMYEDNCKYISDAYACFNTILGQPCGDEGLALTKKLTEALSSYTTGVCLEVGGASTLSTLSWNLLLGILAVVLTWHKY